MKTSTRSDARIVAQIASARSAGGLAKAAEPRAQGARYSGTTGFLTVTLTNRATFSFPAEFVQGLRGASPAQMAKVQVSPPAKAYYGLRSMPIAVGGILEVMIGGPRPDESAWPQRGLARSDAKARAARANGSKGGRPRRLGHRQR